MEDFKLIIARSNSDTPSFGIGLMAASWEDAGEKRSMLVTPYEDGEKSFCEVKILWEPAYSWADTDSINNVKDLEFNSPCYRVNPNVPENIGKSMGMLANSSSHELPNQAKDLFRFFAHVISEKESHAIMLKSQMGQTNQQDDFNARQAYGVVRNN